MKKIIVLLLIITLLSACETQPNGSAPTESSNPAVEASCVPQTPNPSPTELNDLAVESPSPNKRYSFSEVDPLYGPDSFSVDELTKIFGEPTFLIGYCFQNYAFALNVRFEGVMFDFVANNGEVLSYALAHDPQTLPYGSDMYVVSESDKAVCMNPLCTRIRSEIWPLPRNMKIGDSLDKLYDAYDGDKGRKEIAEGSLMVFYDYGETGHIVYIFSDEGEDSTLAEVSITWYDISLLR